MKKFSFYLLVLGMFLIPSVSYGATSITVTSNSITIDSSTYTRQNFGLYDGSNLGCGAPIGTPPYILVGSGGNCYGSVPADGDYILVMNDTGDNTIPPTGSFDVFYFSIVGGIINEILPEPDNTTTRIENMQPNATTTSTSTVTLSADVYINPDDFASSSMYVDFITQRYNRRDLLDSDPNYREFRFTNLVSGMNNLSTTTTFSTNEVIAFSAELKKDNTFWFDQSLAYEFVNFTVIEGSPSDLYYASTSNGATSYVENYSTSTSPADCVSASSITEKAVCKFGEITANVLQTVFTPSQESIDNLTGLKDILVTKPPVGYIYVIATSLTGATTTASSTFTLEANSTLMTNIFTPLRNALNAILWFVFGVFYFIRFKNMNI